MRNVTSRTVAALASICLIQATRAADVTWGPATNITGDSDVSTVGTLVGAANPGPGSDSAFDSPAIPVTSTTVNGVTFNAFPRTGNPTTHGIFTIAETPGELFGRTWGSTLAPFSSLSSAYQGLLDPVITTDSGRTFTVSADGLTIGQEYLFQVWLTKSDGGHNSDSTMTITSGQSLHSVVLDVNNIDANGGVGQFAIANFVADGLSQTFTFEASDGHPFVNAFQLRAVVPEPGAIISLAGAAMLACRRKARRV